MELYGIIGKKLDHSFSPTYFIDKFRHLNIKADYLAFELNDSGDLTGLIQEHKDLVGLNVTVPFKEDVIPLLDNVSNEARLIGAVNTIKIYRTTKGIKLLGYNTDVIGFKTALLPLIENRKDLKAFILGTGGSSKAVAYVLKQLGIPFKLVGRKPFKAQLTYDGLDPAIFLEHQLIINTTPLGMYPDVNSFPEIPYRLITRNHILFDLIYNPDVSQFLKKGREQNAIVENGLLMLHTQADESWKIWQSQD